MKVVICTYGHANMHISCVVMVNIVISNPAEIDKFVCPKLKVKVIHFVICSIE